ncbi:MAG: glycosyltransferase family 9 protein [Verrucomicrobia bacterium]|nr:glycosyltransferase family 9 protein [Verrucomicrobiota bacterium]
MKILILKPSSLGDVVQALPVLRLIKRHLPASGVFAWLANGRLSVGLDEPREGARGFYDHIIQRPSRLTHAVDWYLRVLPVLGVPVDREFQWLPPRPAVAESLQRRWPVDGARWIALQPGARWPNKRWPVESYADLVRLLAPECSGFRFAILGGEEDRALGEVIARADPARCLDLTGLLSLPEMVEWIRQSELMVTNDTGPMHVAAALGRPVVALLGPTEPRRTGPYRQLDHVLQLNLPCVPCFKSHCVYTKPFECLRAIPPSAVFNAVQKRLAASAPRQGFEVVAP